MTSQHARTCQKLFPSFFHIKRQLQSRELPLQLGPRIFNSLHDKGCLQWLFQCNKSKTILSNSTYSIKNLCLSFNPLRSVFLISLKSLSSTMCDMNILFIEKVIMAVFQTITILLCPQFPRAIPRISFNSEIDCKHDIIFLTEIEYVDLPGEP